MLSLVMHRPATETQWQCKPAIITTHVRSTSFIAVASDHQRITFLDH
jgi:hypothetical protein